MDPALKQGIIKLIPKNTFPKSLAEWRPITMMGILYKIPAKIIAIRITLELRKCMHPAQISFIVGRSILDNILTVQIGIEHALVTNQDMVMFQIDFVKAFDTVQWDFVSFVLIKLGFGPRISGFIYLIGQNAYSRVIINGRLFEKVQIARSVRQGCPISPLFFAVATHLLYVYLDSLARNGHLQTLHLGSKQVLGKGFVDDTLLFLKAHNVNIMRCMKVLDVYAIVVGLQLNLQKNPL
ncbi:hypothetical protein L7F22_005376 [Adiantum nelumboides]|nr:hypothetical protein [Adiantum nelumboides]